MAFVIPISLIIKGIDNNGFDVYSCLRLSLIVCGLNEFFFLVNRLYFKNSRIFLIVFTSYFISCDWISHIVTNTFRI